MVLVLDCNLEIGTHVWREFGDLICLGHLFWSKAVHNLNLFSEKTCYRFQMRNEFQATVWYVYRAEYR